MTAQKKLIFIIIPLLFLTLIATVLLYFGALKLVKLGLYLSYSKVQTKQEKQSLISEFTGQKQDKKISGFLAGTTQNYLWLWTLKGLTGVKISSIKPAYYYLDVCSKNPAVEAENQNSSEIKTEIFFEKDKWLDRAKPGNYAIVYYFYNEQNGNEKLLDKIWGYNGDVYMKTTLGRTCSII